MVNSSCALTVSSKSKPFTPACLTCQLPKAKAVTYGSSLALSLPS
jgi:hypothetical protein